VFQTLLVDPLYNLLVFLYDVIPGQDVGIAIIILTIIVKLLLAPLSMKSLKAQKALQDLQPKIDEVRKKYKDDREKQSKELMKVYSTNKVNPLSSCLPLLVQFPILIGLYRVFIDGFTEINPERLYPFVQNPGMIDPVFMSLVDLSQPFIAFALVAGALQFVQAKMFQSKQAAQKKEKDTKAVSTDKKSPTEDALNMSSMVTKQLMYFMPIITVVIAVGLPSALALYWSVSTLFAIGQQWYIMKVVHRS
jgi:YidC/Oxa1 family membrane protein insertase